MLVINNDGVGANQSKHPIHGIGNYLKRTSVLYSSLPHSSSSVLPCSAFPFLPHSLHHVPGMMEVKKKEEEEIKRDIKFNM